MDLIPRAIDTLNVTSVSHNWYDTAVAKYSKQTLLILESSEQIRSHRISDADVERSINHKEELKGLTVRKVYK